jgi:ferredoxin
MAVTKVWIETGDCISCEACVSECDAVFEMGDDAAVVKAEAQNPEFLAAHTEGIKAAIEACPSEAIKVEED